MSDYQEPYDQIDPASRELERARRSLCEEQSRELARIPEHWKRRVG